MSTIRTGDMLSFGTLGWWNDVTSPGAPALLVASDGDGDAVTATVTGDAGATHQLYYRIAGAASWTTGNSRTGDGNIAQAGLDDDTWYEFIAISQLASLNSAPSITISVFVTSGGSLAATGSLTLAEDALANLVAHSGTFQTWIGATGTEAQRVAAALARIYIDVEDSPTRPFAVVRFDVPAEQEDAAIAGGASAQFGDSGTLGLAFEAAVDTDYTDPADQMRSFKRTVDSILNEMKALATSGGYLIVRRIRVAEGPLRVGITEAMSDSDFMQMVFSVDYGGLEA